jgi:hypothetical protein
MNSLTANIVLNKKVYNKVISPKLTHSPFSIPDSPQYMSVNNIKKIDNIYVLKKLEYEYNNFLEKKCHILLMLNMVEEVFEIRDEIIIRINSLKRQQQKFQQYMMQ